MLCIGYTTRWRSLRDIYTTEGRRPEVVYTVETDTELHNRLVPWGIATRLRSNGIKTAIRHGMGSHREQRNAKEVELREILPTTAATDIDLDAIILD